MAPQPSESPFHFSHVGEYHNAGNIDDRPPLIQCHLTRTNPQTHALVVENAHLLPNYDVEGGVGPRYCPSLPKKVERFGERDGHNSFLEPEGFDSELVYPNGLSGPFPEEVQLAILRTMEGLGAVEIQRPGYDVEYDHIDPSNNGRDEEGRRTGLDGTLEARGLCEGMFFAGQIICTTGYEEVRGGGRGDRNGAERSGAS